MPIALDRAAIREGYSVLFVTAPALVAALAKAHGEGRLEERLGFYAKPKLLIVDELGYLPFEPNAAHPFFQLAAGGRGWRWRPRSRRTRCPIRRP
jgi:DNA replication protein DnaC